MNPLQAQFRNGTPPAGAAPAARAVIPTSRYGGQSAGSDKYPRPAPGRYRLEVVKSGETNTPGQDPYFYIDFKVVSSSVGAAEGTVVHFDQCVSAKALSVGGPKIKRAVMAILGVDEPTFNTLSGPAGDGREILDAAAGYPAANSEGVPYPENLLAGCIVDVDVSLGKEVLDPKTKLGTGDHYRNYVFTPAAAG